MTHPIPDYTSAPLRAGARALLDADTVRAADAEWLKARIGLQMMRLNRFLMWMDGAGIPRRQFSLEWFEAVAPTLPQCQIAHKTKSKSNAERNWTWLLADVLYAERQGYNGPERFNFLKGQPGFRDRWGYQSKGALEIRLSEARNKSIIGRMIMGLRGEEVRANFEEALIAACSAAELQTVVTDFK